MHCIDNWNIQACFILATEERNVQQEKARLNTIFEKFFIFKN